MSRDSDKGCNQLGIGVQGHIKDTTMKEVNFQHPTPDPKKSRDFIDSKNFIPDKEMMHANYCHNTY